MMTIQFLDYAGVFVFAVSGALMAAEKNMDIFGFVVLALMPAVGGGTIRDLILGVEVFWVSDNVYLFVTLGAAIATYLAHSLVRRLQLTLTWMDAVGLSVFCALGAAKALELTGNPVIAVVMGVITAVAGGIIRDVIANEVPLVLHREVYATAAFAGSLTYISCYSLAPDIAIWPAMVVALVVRSCGILFDLALPTGHGTNQSEDE